MRIKNLERDLTVFERILNNDTQSEIARDLGLSVVRVGAIWRRIQELLIQPEIIKDTVILRREGSPVAMREEKEAWLVLVNQMRGEG